MGSTWGLQTCPSWAQGLSGIPGPCPPLPGCRRVGAGRGWVTDQDHSGPASWGGSCAWGRTAPASPSHTDAGHGGRGHHETGGLAEDPDRPAFQDADLHHLLGGLVSYCAAILSLG